MPLTATTDPADVTAATVQTRVLVVDDEAIVREVLRRTLAAEGYAVQTARSADDALTQIKERAPDLVLTDMAMPGGTGLDLCRAVRELGGSHIPVIVLSGLGREADITSGYDAGADDYVLKPWREAELFAKVRRHAIRVRREAKQSVSTDGMCVWNGRVVLGATLGVGGMGRVYRGRDRETGTEVAVKVLRRDLADDEQFVRRFVNEARILKQLRTAGVPRVRHLGRSGGRLYYVMDLFEGLTLADQVKCEGALSVERCLGVARELSEIIGELTSAGVLHRDIKPDNIVCRPDGGASLLDFGIARFVADARLTAPDKFVGTPGYVAPECFGYDEEPGFAAEMYQLGMTLWYCVTGEQPPSRPNLVAAVGVSLDPVPAELRTLMGSLVATDPRQRPSCPAELADAITDAEDQMRGTRAVA